jgi:hypothetical protein
MLFLFLKIRFIIFAFQCDNLIQQQIDLNAELDLAKKNLRAFESEMDKKVLELDVNRKQRKLEWLAADFEYHSHRKKLFLAQSKKCLIKELKSNFIHLVCFQVNRYQEIDMKIVYFVTTLLSTYEQIRTDSTNWKDILDQLLQIAIDIVATTQGHDSGIGKRPEPAGRRRENHRTRQENSGTRRNMEAVFRLKVFSDFSRCFTRVSCQKERKASRKSSEKIRKCSGRNTAPRFH